MLLDCTNIQWYKRLKYDPDFTFVCWKHVLISILLNFLKILCYRTVEVPWLETKNQNYVFSLLINVPLLTIKNLSMVFSSNLACSLYWGYRVCRVCPAWKWRSDDSSWNNEAVAVDWFWSTFALPCYNRKDPSLGGRDAGFLQMQDIVTRLWQQG